jgi:cysteinyl-tRNA synthetase
MTLRLFNTLGRQEQEFHPRTDAYVGMYCCGPTVYQYAHIGNLRTYVFEDLLRRVLEYFGYSVEHVMNITDVGHLTDDADQGEDKMFESSRELGQSVWEIAEHFTQAFFADTDKLNIERPHQTPRATEHIEDMIRLIQRIEANGYTYEAGGNIYFDTEKFPNYGELALLERQDQQAGARVEVDSYKRHPRDFVLWFTRSKFGRQTMMWDSPWGYGYPGWHIECSAMSMRYLGDQFDIHCGGIDHIPVHHTNEIAQSEAATGKKWVNYWIHGEFLIMDTGKMSKSKGGFVTLGTLEEEGFEPLDYRYFCLGGHYRSQLQFSYDALVAARRARLNLLERIGVLEGEVAGGDGNGTAPEQLESRINAASQAAQDYLRRFEQHLAGDLNTPKALAELWSVIKDETVSERDKLSVIARMDRVLGLKLLEEKIAGTPEELDEDLQELIRERASARKERNFARADEIRDILVQRGIVLEDTPQGTRWKKV